MDWKKVGVLEILKLKNRLCVSNAGVIDLIPNRGAEMPQAEQRG